MKTIISVLLLCMTSLAFAQDHQYTFVFLNKKSGTDTTSQERLKKIMEGHHSYREKLHQEGKLLAAGPFEGGGGVYVLNTKNVSEAKQWVDGDPGVQAQRWNIEILPFRPTRGGICPVGANYTMTSYTFVRFAPLVTKTTASDAPQILRRHEAFIRETVSADQVVTEASFGDRDGGILVLRNQIEKAVLEKDPGVAEGLLELDIRKLFIAKGSFCEK